MARAEEGALVGTVFFLLADVPLPWGAESKEISIPGGGCTVVCFPFLPNGFLDLRFGGFPRFLLTIIYFICLPKFNEKV